MVRTSLVGWRWIQGPDTGVMRVHIECGFFHGRTICHLLMHWGEYRVVTSRVIWNVVIILSSDRTDIALILTSLVFGSISWLFSSRGWLNPLSKQGGGCSTTSMGWRKQRLCDSHWLRDNQTHWANTRKVVWLTIANLHNTPVVFFRSFLWQLIMILVILSYGRG